MAELLKNVFFTRPIVTRLAGELKQAGVKLDEKKFLSGVFDRAWRGRELKERLRHVTLAMDAVLPDDYGRALNILEKVAPAFSGFDGMIFPDYVEIRGQAERDRSLRALKSFTRYSSSEFAVRSFLLNHHDTVMAFLLECAHDKNHHVRRWASEGCRPRLPWAMGVPALKRDPGPILPILEVLKDDETEYVRKSVANNINDISKDHAELVLDLCERWHGESERTDWIVKHGLRGLLKKGEPRALRLFGFGADPGAKIAGLKATPRNPKIGGETLLSFDLTLKKKTRIRIEYRIFFLTATGRQSPKVFQIGEKEYPAGTHAIEKRHSFVDRTTRKHHPGPHKIELILNGVVKAATQVKLKR